MRKQMDADLLRDLMLNGSPLDTGVSNAATPGASRRMKPIYRLNPPLVPPVATPLPVARPNMEKLNPLVAGAASTELLARLKGRVIGHDEACEELVGCIRRYRAGLAAPNRPVGIYLLVGPTGSGKAQPLTSKVYTPTGPALMGDVYVGMRLLTATGDIQTVEGVYPQGEQDIYKVTFADGRQVECTSDHLWRVYNKYWEPKPTYKVLPLSEIAKHVALGRDIKVQLPAPVAYRGKDLIIDPYLLGVLIGDGSLGYSTNFSTADVEISRAVEALMPSECSVRHIANYDYTIVTPRGASNPMTDALRDLGLFGCKSYEKFIPAIYLRGSIEQRWALLQGLMDTDGFAGNMGSTSYCTTSLILAEQVRELVWSLGGIASLSSRQPVYTYKGQKKRGRVAYIVNVRVPTPSKLFRLERKHQRCINYQYSEGHRELRLRIASVELVGREEVQCIKVSNPDSLYLTDGYVVTHNTMIAKALASEVTGKGDTLLRIDCAEYQHGHEVSKLTGAPPSYLGHRETKALLSQDNLNVQTTTGQPLSFLLLDEIDKSHERLLDIFMGIFDTGRCTIGDNSTVKFNNTIILMTANSGAKEMEASLSPTFGLGTFASSEAPPDLSKAGKIGEVHAKKLLRPEFFNRLDKILVFHQLTPAEIRKILQLELAALETRMLEGPVIGLTISEPAKDWLAEQGYDPKYGARHLKRSIEKFLSIPLANLITSDQAKKGSVIRVELDEEGALGFYA